MTDRPPRRGIRLKDEPPATESARAERPRLDYAFVGAAAQGHWPEIHTRLGVDPALLSDDPKKKGPCPGCGGTDRFTYDNIKGRGTFKCGRGGDDLLAGDGFALLMHVYGWSKTEALHAVADLLGLADGRAGEHPAITAVPAIAPAAKDDKANQYAKAAARVQLEWERASPAAPGHPYLIHKGIPPLIARMDPQGRLLIPVYGADGAMQSVERITPDGQKKFAHLARAAGGWCEVQTGADGAPVALVEGYATGCSIALAMPTWRVVVGFSAGNLVTVALMLRAADAARTLLICGDDDSAKHSGKDPGRAAAIRAAGAARGLSLLPPVPGDWNDYHHDHGIEALQRALTVALDRAPEQVAEPSTSVSSNQDIRHSEVSRNAPDTGLQGALIVTTAKGPMRMVESAAAEIIADALRGQLAFDSEAATWLLWSETHWQALLNAAKADKLIADTVTVGLDWIGYRVGYLTGVTSIITRRGLLPPPAWPSNVAPFVNGLLDLGTNEVRPARPGFALDWCLPHRYDPAADCPNIKAWLSAAVEYDADTVQLLRAWLAALVRGIPLQVFLVLIGRGGSGKGTFQRLAMALVGSQNAAVSTLRDLEENRFELAKIFGKRLLMINEAGHHGGSVNMLKAITGGDHLPLERKHQQQAGTFIFGGLVLMATNEQLASSDATSGLERRRVTVRFPKSATPDDRADWEARGGEGGVLHAEIPGLVRWLLDMPVTEIRARFEAPPPRVTADNLLGMAAGNSVADWLMECCIPGKHNGYDDDPYCVQIGIRGEKRESGVLVYEHADRWAYPNYLSWCAACGRTRPVSLQRFGSIVIDMAETLGHQVHRAQHPTLRSAHLYGLRLRTAVEAAHNWVGAAPELTKDLQRRKNGQAIDSQESKGRRSELYSQTKTAMSDVANVSDVVVFE